MFDPHHDPPSLLAPQDRVRFVPAPGPSQPPGAMQGRSGSSAEREEPAARQRGTPLLRVLVPGFLTTIQDAGRVGFQRFGVPAAGALDPFALQAANRLVGNEPDAAGLEITLGDFSVQALDDVRLALTGAHANVVVFSENLGPWQVPMWKDLLLRRGTVLKVRDVSEGCRVYLSASGGFAVPDVLGARATYLGGKFGGLDGRALQVDDVLFGSGIQRGPATLGGWEVPATDRPPYGNDAEVRVIWGPHARLFHGGSPQHTAIGQLSSQRHIRSYGPAPCWPRAETRAAGGAPVLRDGAWGHSGPARRPAHCATSRPADGRRLPDHRHSRETGHRPAGTSPARRKYGEV